MRKKSWAKVCYQWCNDRPSAMLRAMAPVYAAFAFVLQQLLYPFLRIGDFFHVVSEYSNRFLTFVVERFYLPALNWSIRNTWSVICLAYAMMFVSIAFVRSGAILYETFPDMDSYLIEAKVTYPDGTPESITDAATQRINQALTAVSQRLTPEYSVDGEPLVRTVRRAVGDVRDEGLLGPEGRATGSHVGKVDAELVQASNRRITSQDFIEAWRIEAGEFPGCESITFGSPEMGPGGTPIEFRLLGNPEDMHLLEQAVEDCKLKLTEYAGVVDIRDDSKPGKWEFQLKVKDKAESLGITLNELARTVRAAYYGDEVMRLQRGRHEVKLMVRYPPEERTDIANLEDIRIRRNGMEYPLSELADVTIRRGYAEINRIDQKRSITVLADTDGANVSSRDITEELRAEHLPEILKNYPGITVRWEGQQEQTNDSVQSLVRGLIVALLVMFVLLTLEFRSYFQPAIILAVIPFGIVGAIWGHAFMGITLTIFTLFGLVALTGVVVNDSIVLIDFINQRLAAGDAIGDALLAAGRRRFRPVLLTSVTTIAGLSPMLTETSFQAQFLIPLAATMVFGLLVATVMVLILVPVFYLSYYRMVHGRQSFEQHDLGDEAMSIPSPAMLDVF